MTEHQLAATEPARRLHEDPRHQPVRLAVTHHPGQWIHRVGIQSARHHDQVRSIGLESRNDDPRHRFEIGAVSAAWRQRHVDVVAGASSFAVVCPSDLTSAENCRPGGWKSSRHRDPDRTPPAFRCRDARPNRPRQRVAPVKRPALEGSRSECWRKCRSLGRNHATHDGRPAGRARRRCPPCRRAPHPDRPRTRPRTSATMSIAMRSDPRPFSHVAATVFADRADLLDILRRMVTQDVALIDWRRRHARSACPPGR